MQLLTDLAKRGITVQEVDGQLRCIGTLDDGLRAMIRENKPAILAALRERQSPARSSAREKPDVGPVSLDPVEYLRIAAELIAACPESLRAGLKRYHDERLRWWRSVPEVAFAADGPPVMAYGDLDELCQREHGVWLAVWYLPDGKFRTEVCRAERRRPEAIQQRQQAAMPESRETKTDNSLFAGSV